MTAPGEARLMRVFFEIDEALPVPVAVARSRSSLRQDTEARVEASGGMDEGPVEPWPERWWSENDPADAQACRALWSDVLMTCIAGSIHDRFGGGLVTGTYGRVEAAWLDSRDFYAVCALAGLDGVAVRDRVAAVWHDELAARALMYRLLSRSQKLRRRRQCAE